MRLKFAYRAVLIVVASGLAQPGAGQQHESISLTVRTGQPGPIISRDIFGQFAEQLGNGIDGGVWVGKGSPIPNVRGIRSDVVQALRALEVPNVRWPGGCFADQYHWRNGIGPAARRRTTYNINWGNPVELNRFGSDEYMDFIEQIGSEANITVNVGSGSPQEAADWLEYLTADRPTTLARERAANGHAAPYRVKFMGIGNESYGCGGPMTADAYVDRMKIFSHFVRNLNPTQSGPTLFAPGPDPMRRIAVGAADDQTDYTEAAMKAWQASSPRYRPFEALSFHHYTMGALGAMRDLATGFGEQEYATFLKNSYVMDELIRKQSAIMDRYDPGKHVALSIDEWGVWLQPMPGTQPLYLQQQNSLRDALVAAVHLNIFARHADRVRMANIAQMVNVLQSMILTDGAKMVLTPTYHVFRMYVPFQDSRLIPIELNAGSYRLGAVTLPEVDVIAARATDGKIWLALINLDPNRPASVVADVPGLQAKSASGEVLTATRVNAVNTSGDPRAVFPRPFFEAAAGGKLVLNLPPKSLTIVHLDE
jgi:alpha-L-arabinofuranosidase